MTRSVPVESRLKLPATAHLHDSAASQGVPALVAVGQVAFDAAGNWY
ncbi:MAG: hypothetical protein ABSG41_26085 [Bryobacteraceae bacterium]|jgi:hypothetical protein